ncbi:uncharacterized protein BDCG_05887 [Blastomyces dermatitidis ER-3]|uniref:Uncharacterized protein n=1 Tax=Ajellomyces dermatitidis (strain ER-3 / ATCC MYA-2586) TaxID=559297 RepID=A0ABP2F1Z5_AJEDR|nr:uncharacterized protein BDCG_05887 [Blastomyces dermatitidis ER-3]EEQ90767.2 hypothetical protein BDCG_05887 [Blastomyces dermatitidis ER-3]
MWYSIFQGKLSSADCLAVDGAGLLQPGKRAFIRGGNMNFWATILPVLGTVLIMRPGQMSRDTSAPSERLGIRYIRKDAHNLRAIDPWARIRYVRLASCA